MCLWGKIYENGYKIFLILEERYRYYNMIFIFDYRFQWKARENIYEISTTEYCIAEAGEVMQFDLEIWLCW